MTYQKTKTFYKLNRLLLLGSLSILPTTLLCPGDNLKADSAVRQVENQIYPTPDYRGALDSRSTITGDWGGARQDLANKGVTLDLELTQVTQGVTSGGIRTGWEYMGRGQSTLNLDTAKMGLWPGGLFTVQGEGNFGTPLTKETGALLGVNANELFPEVENSYVLSNVTYTQFFCPQFGIALGKFATISKQAGDMNAFAHGTGTRQFLNPALSFNPVTALTVPYSTLGASLIFLPNKDWIATAALLDPHGTPNSAGVDRLYEDGVTFAMESRYTTRFFNLLGHQLIGGTLSTSDYTDLDQRVTNLIFPGIPVQESEQSWSLTWNADQYIYQPDANVDRGIGIFARYGKSDGIANPIEHFASAGFGGKGMIPGRENDGFGIGYFYAWSADTRITRTTGFGDAQGLEAYYEFALTPAVIITPDIQWISPSQERVDSSWNTGLRLYTSF